MTFTSARALSRQLNLDLADRLHEGERFEVSMVPLRSHPPRYSAGCDYFVNFNGGPIGGPARLNKLRQKVDAWLNDKRIYKDGREYRILCGF